jgi:hypothetical protein
MPGQRVISLPRRPARLAQNARTPPLMQRRRRSVRTAIDNMASKLRVRGMRVNDSVWSQRAGECL